MRAASIRPRLELPDPAVARERLKALLRERSLREGVDVVLASGKKSDVYVDGKQVTLEGEGLLLVASLILRQMEGERVTAVGGLTLGADPIASGVALLSHLAGRPLRAFLVRKDPKTHGTKRSIEGGIGREDRVVLVDDVITTGGSVLKAAEAVRAAGAEIAFVSVVVDREDPDGAAALAPLDYRPIFRLSELRTRP
ncbi:MAG: orotate phosphoribosyltransferase [Planctomycetes bacterium]|nr:orotate phosphoribosyltransferase [Planctomycetota bacterium]